MITTSEFEQLFRAFFAQLFKLANYMLNDVEESRDVVHEVFAQLWEKQPQIEDGKIREYLLRATYNRCLNSIKHKGIFDAMQESYLNELRYDLLNNDFDWELWNQILQFIQTEIPPRTRQALDLCFGEQLSYKEAAERMNVSIEAINKHIVKGLRMLRERFKKKLRL